MSASASGARREQRAAARPMARLRRSPLSSPSTYLLLLSGLTGLFLGTILSQLPGSEAEAQRGLTVIVLIVLVFLGVLLIVEGQRDNLLRRIANNDRRIEGLMRSMMLQAARIDFARSQRIDAEITEEEGREFLDIWKRLDSEQHDEVQELANAMREIAGAAQRREQLHIADR